MIKLSKLINEEDGKYKVIFITISKQEYETTVEFDSEQEAEDYAKSGEFTAENMKVWNPKVKRWDTTTRTMYKSPEDGDIYADYRVEPSDIRTVYQQRISKAIWEDMIKLTDLYKESTNPSVYKVLGTLIVNTEDRSLTDVLSDIRAIPGVTIVQTRNNPTDTKDPISKRHIVKLSIKMDPAPFKPFNLGAFKYILSQIKKVPAVVSAKFVTAPVVVDA